MFTVVNDFCNYDLTNLDHSPKTNRKEPKPKNTSLQEEPFQIIANFTTKITEDVVLAQDTVNITCLVNSRNFIMDILKSYLNYQQLSQQFLMDVKRSCLFINGKRVKVPVSALNYLEYTHQEKTGGLLACVTQATCAAAFDWLSTSLPEDYYLSELNKGSAKRSIIKINGTKVRYRKGLRIFKLVDGDDYTVRIVIMTITVDDAIDYKGDVTIQFKIKSIL